MCPKLKSLHVFPKLICIFYVSCSMQLSCSCTILQLSKYPLTRGGRWPFWGSTDDHANRVCFSRIFPSCGYHLRGEIPSCGGQIKGKIPRHGCILTKSPYMRVMNLRFSQNKCMKWVPWTICGSKCWVWDKNSLDPGKLFRLDFP